MQFLIYIAHKTTCHGLEFVKREVDEIGFLITS